MAAPYGHNKIVASLQRFLPRAVLFVGPYSVGRWETAEHIRRNYGLDNDDVLRIHQPTVQDVHAAMDWALTPPAHSIFKLVIIELYKADNGTQTALCNALEFLGNARWIVIAEPGVTLPGILSRTVAYFFRPLQSADVSKILQERYSFGEERANTLAVRSNGQVYKALQLADSDKEISLVRQALTALRNRDEEALYALSGKWTDETTALLAQWCHETISGQWRVFDHEDYVAGRALPLKILMAIRVPVRPKLVVRSQLIEVLRGS